MSEIYILRHGIAEPRKEGRPDEERALTKEGRDKLELVLARARVGKVAPKVVLTSPLVRAKQTAEAAVRALGRKTKLVESEALVPGSSPQAIWDEVRRVAGKGPVLIVGHEPLLGETVSFLLGVDSGVVDLKKGALAYIEVDPKDKRPRGALEWLITPKVCQDGSA